MSNDNSGAHPKTIFTTKGGRGKFVILLAYTLHAEVQSRELGKSSRYRGSLQRASGSLIAAGFRTRSSRLESLNLEPFIPQDSAANDYI